MDVKKILFQGDSITDAGRLRENDAYMGSGYPTIVSGKLGFDYPGLYTFQNRGISGNRVVDIYARMKADIINLKPDFMSILIGVNDVSHEIAHQNGVAAEKYEKVYTMLIEEILNELPNLKIMLLEPFVLKAFATEEKWEYFNSETKKRGAAAKRVAEKFSLPFVPLQNPFDEAEKLAPATHWVQDGVHPTAAGHELIARSWIETFEKIK